MSRPSKPPRFAGPTVVARIWRLFQISCISLVILLAAFLVGLERAKITRLAIVRTSEVQQNLFSLGEDLLNAETGQRGYLLTGNDEYLKPYTLGATAAEAHLDKLRGLMSDRADKAYLDRISPTVHAKLSELVQTISLARSGQHDAALLIVNGATGQRLMDQFRELRNATLAGQQKLLEQQRISANNTFLYLASISVFGGSLTFVMLYLYTRQTIQKLGKPIHDLVAAMHDVAAGSTNCLLEVVSSDEIGAMSSAFNAMTQRLAIARSSAEEAVSTLQVSYQTIRARESALRESESRLTMITDNIPGLICYLDMDLRYRFVNRTYGEWFGLDPKSFIGKTLREAQGETVFREMQRKLEMALSGAMVTDERQLVVADKVRHCQFVIVPQITDTGNVNGLIVIHFDISSRRDTELALRESQGFLSRTGAAAGVGGWELNLVTQAVTWSEETRRLHDVDAQYVPTVDSAIRFYTPQSQIILQQAIEECISRAKPYDLELELVSAKGRHFWARATGTAEFDNGNAVRLVGAFQDVTERRRLEQKLAESYELVRVTLDSIADAVITTDAQGRVQWLNPVAESMTGWTKSDSYGRPSEEVFCIKQTETGYASVNPVAVCLAESRTVGLQMNTTLVSKLGKEYGMRTQPPQFAAPMARYWALCWCFTT